MLTFVKFSLVGAFNTAVDFAVLNVLIFLFGTGGHGELYVVFKTVSFLAAVVNSYYLNKTWVFARKNPVGESPRAKEGALFLAISSIGLLLNVAISAGVFFIVTPILPISAHFAANIGASLGSGAVLLWNFLGYKYIVFQDRHE